MDESNPNHLVRLQFELDRKRQKAAELLKEATKVNQEKVSQQKRLIAMKLK